MTAPRVSFLLPMYNNAGTVGETIRSVLGQTFADFELLILDDASTDGSGEVVRSLGDSRIRVQRNEENRELAATLNCGLSLARGEYVARIDADDLCLPVRIARQVEFLDTHPEIAVVGSFIETFSDGEGGMVLKYPTQPEMIAAALLFRNPLAHPAVMMRKKVIAGLRYDEACRRGQDLDLWVRCVLMGVKLANIPEVLTQYRVHPGQATARDAAGGRHTSRIARVRLLERLGIQASLAELETHERLSWEELLREGEWLRGAAGWLEKIYAANEGVGFFDREALGGVLCGRWVRVLRLAKEAGVDLGRGEAGGSPLAKYLHAGAV